jgi:hypothetical protein
VAIQTGGKVAKGLSSVHQPAARLRFRQPPIARCRLARPDGSIGLVATVVQARLGVRDGEESMEPRIDGTQFGSVTIDGETITHDVIIRLGGRVEKRKKKLSKAVYGTSHTISLAEAEHLYQKGAERLLIGAGQEGRVELSEEAAGYFARKRCRVELLETPAVIPVWNQAEGAVIGLVHVTC